MNYYKYLRIGFFNINSLVGDTTFDPDFLTFIEKYDIISLSETWHQNLECIKKVKQNFPVDFRFIENARKKKHKNSKRNSGGIIVCYKKFLHKHISIIDKKTENMIWIKLNKDFLNQKENLFIGAVYISPINSSYTKNNDEDTFTKIQDKILTINQDDFIIIGGDFNARTGNLQDDVKESEKERELLNLPNNYKISSFTKARCNQDQHKNTYGDKLIDITTSSNMKILNGRTLGDLEGRYTYIGYNGLSTVDYVLGSENMLTNNIHSFVVEELTNFSDHRPTCLTLQYMGTKAKEMETGNFLLNRPRNKMKLDDYESYQKYLNNKLQINFIEPLINRIENLDTNIPTELDGIIHTLNEQYISKDTISFDVRKAKSRKSRLNNNPWYTDDCKTMKNRLNQVRKMLEKNPNKQEIRILFYKTRKKYNKLVKQQRRKHEETITQKLECLYSNDRNEFWKHLKSMKSNTKEENLPHLDKLITHFEYLYHKPDLDVDTESNETEIDKSKENNIFDKLNEPITEEEVNKIKKQLKKGKAAAFDLITNEMIKATNENGIKLLTKLFNALLKHKYFPKDWNYGILRLIHKGDDPDDANNYRAITLNSCLGKFFCTILNTRFTSILEHENIICKEQAAFRKNSRTTDQIFLLKHIVRIYISNNKYLYTCFVDFSKAFDSIWRKALVGKLSKIGLHGNFLEIIKSIYESTTNSIIYGDKLTKTFKSNIGVKQGDTLSTTLFNLYLNDLPNEFIFDGNDSVKIGQSDISCLLYADDLIIMATSPEALQKCITKLEQYCTKWKLEVNLKKTKVMIFNKQGSLIKKHKFSYKNNMIENVREYKYLGFLFTCSGSDQTGITNLLKQAKKAWFAIRYYLRKSENKHINTYLHIFESQVRPIILYACEAWADTLKDDKSLLENIQRNSIEKFHISVLKQILGVHKKTSNIAVLVETGIHPLSLTSKMQAIKYFLRLPSIDKNKLLHTYHESQKIEKLGTFTKFITNSLDKIGMSSIWRDQLIENKDNSNDKKLAKSIKRRLEDISSQTITSKLAESSKLTFLASIKHEHKFEPYLNIHNFEHRRALTKLRTSSHKLEIEVGRWNDVQKEDRICKNCLLNKIEDEFHLLFDCHMHMRDRSKLFETLQQKIDVNTKNKIDQVDTINKIFASDDLSLLNAIGKFIKNSLQKRENTTLYTLPPHYVLYHTEG